MTKLKLIILLLLALNTSAAEVRFAWKANAEPVEGYRLYWGPASRFYTNSVTISPGLTNYSMQVSGKQYFALTAFNGILESPFSGELLYSPVRVVSERSLDGVLWQPAITNYVQPLWAVEFWRLQIYR